MADKKIRTRFAPSPTGYMHVGNLRTALYTYLTAKHKKGDFVLRIEDTDQERYVEGAVDIIYSTLKETGLIWDEGPDIGGEYGPYIQSERMGMYKKYADELIEKGKAYPCFCSKERLDEMRTIQKASGQPIHYDGHCRHLSKEEADKKIANGEPYVVRQAMPKEGKTVFEDVIYGIIEVDNDTLDDSILIKTDGMPTYNFANVIDDHLMAVTHIIRGSEYLSSAPKYNLLYQSFDWDIPTYIHCPPVMKDAQNKLSKRNGDASYEDLIEQGFLKEAVINYILLLGWSPKGEREIFSLEEMIEVWDYSSINKSPAIFDTKKLRYINAEYLHAMSPDEFFAATKPYIDEAVKNERADKRLIAEVLQPRCEVFSDIPEQLDFIDALPDYDIALFTSKKMKTSPETAYTILCELLPVLQEIELFNKDEIHARIFEFIKEKEVKNGFVLWPLRVAVSGKQFTPGGGIELAAILGKKETIERVETALKKLKNT